MGFEDGSIDIKMDRLELRVSSRAYAVTECSQVGGYQHTGQ